MKNQYSLTILRHAQSELNSKNTYCGWINCGITEEGKELSKQLKNVEPFLSGFDIIFSSPLLRAHQTLNCIFPEAKPIDDKRLLVINYGDLEGVDKSSISPELIKAYKDGTATPPNGENFHDVEKRAMCFLNDIHNKYCNTNKRILVVTHGSILRALGPLCNKPISESSNNLDHYTFDQNEIKEYIKGREENDY